MKNAQIIIDTLAERVGQLERKLSEAQQLSQITTDALLEAREELEKLRPQAALAQKFDELTRELLEIIPLLEPASLREDIEEAQREYWSIS